MLCLRRKKNESIQAGPVTVTVAEITGKTVLLGFDAPRNVPIFRQEVIERIERAAKEGRLAELREAMDGEDNSGEMMNDE